MIYKNFPEKIYEEKYRELEKEFINLNYPINNEVFGKSLFYTNKYSLYFFVDDYAAFLAHYNSHHNEGTLYMGLKVTQNFVSFWDYLGFSFYLMYELNIESKVYFCNAMDKTKEFFKDYKKPQKLINKLIKLYEKDATIRKKYRDPTTHKFLSIFFRNNAEEKINDMLITLSNDLHESFYNIIDGFKVYHEFINNYSPYIVIRRRKEQ